MSDLLDGPAITGPRIAAGGTPPGSTVELDDTPGAVLPAGRLHESPQGRTAGRRKVRLIMAWELFCSKHAGTHVTNGNQDELRAWCWRMADAFLADDAAPPPAAALPPGGDARADQLPLYAVRYLSRLVAHGPLAPTDATADARRWLFRCGYGEWVGGDEYGATAKGRALFAAGGVLVNEEHEAA